MLSVSYHVNAFLVSVFMSCRKPNTARSCRASLEPFLTTPSSSLTGVLLRVDEFHPPRRRASPVQDESWDFAQWVRRTSVVLFMESSSLTGCRYASMSSTLHGVMLLPCEMSPGTLPGGCVVLLWFSSWSRSLAWTITGSPLTTPGERAARDPPLPRVPCASPSVTAWHCC
jgi:hypothetical protein